MNVKQNRKNTHNEGKNKAGYTATPVACGWARAVFELLEHLGRSKKDKTPINAEKVKCDGQTGGPTDGPTCTVVVDQALMISRFLICWVHGCVT